MSLFIGFLLVLVGCILMYYSNRFKDWFGEWSFAETNLGGTQQGIVLVGFFFIVLGLLALMGVVKL